MQHKQRPQRRHNNQIKKTKSSLIAILKHSNLFKSMKQTVIKLNIYLCIVLRIVL